FVAASENGIDAAMAYTGHGRSLSQMFFSDTTHPTLDSDNLRLSTDRPAPAVAIPGRRRHQPKYPPDPRKTRAPPPCPGFPPTSLPSMKQPRWETPSAACNGP